MRVYYMIFYRDDDDFATLKPYDNWRYDSEAEALSVVTECMDRRSPYANMTILKFYTHKK